jgi:hypothetical protein
MLVWIVFVAFNWKTRKFSSFSRVNKFSILLSVSRIGMSATGIPGKKTRGIYEFWMPGSPPGFLPGDEEFSKVNQEIFLKEVVKHVEIIQKVSPKFLNLSKITPKPMFLLQMKN